MPRVQNLFRHDDVSAGSCYGGGYVNKRLDITGLKLVFGTNVPWKTVFVFCADLHETVKMLLVLVNNNALKFFKGCLIKMLLVTPGCV